MASIAATEFGEVAATTWLQTAIALGGALHDAFTTAVNLAITSALQENGAIAKAIQVACASTSVEVLQVESST